METDLAVIGRLAAAADLDIGYTSRRGLVSECRAAKVLGISRRVLRDLGLRVWRVRMFGRGATYYDPRDLLRVRHDPYVEESRRQSAEGRRHAQLAGSRPPHPSTWRGR